jgi:hypothetical protein
MPACNLHMIFQVPYIYDYITINAGNKQRSYNIMKMQIFATAEMATPDTKYKRLKLDAGQAYDSQKD